MLPQIKNKLEKECVSYLHQYVIQFKDLYRKPVNLLDYYIGARIDLIALQPPYIDYSQSQRHSDWSLILPRLNIYNRYEIKSLDVNDSALCHAAYQQAIDCCKTMKEKHMYLILLGRGYDDLVKYKLLPLIQKKKLPLTIFRSLNEYRNHVDLIFN